MSTNGESSSLDVFASLSTGNVSSDEHLHLLRQVENIPNFIRGIDYQAVRWDEKSFEGEIRRDEIATMALDHSGISFLNARDALVTIFAVVGKANVVPSISLATLARQALEAGLVSRWILGDLQIDTLRSRGYAAAWSDYQRSLQFFDSAVSSGSIAQATLLNWKSKLAKTKNELLEFGRVAKFVKSGKNNELSPRQTLPSFSELTKSVETQTGTLNIKWLYSVLSGLAHGATWAVLAATELDVVLDHLKTDSSGKRVSAGHSLTNFLPRTNIVAMASSIAMHQIRIVYDLQVKMRTMPSN